MKRLFLLLVAVSVAAAAGAQVPVKYQGEVDLGVRSVLARCHRSVLISTLFRALRSARISLRVWVLEQIITFRARI